MKKYLILLITSLFLFIACDSTSEPEDILGGLDPDLVGTWYRINNDNSDIPHLKQYVEGLRFTDDVKYEIMYYKMSTGKLIPESEYNLIASNGGKLYFETPSGVRVEYQYNVDGNTLQVSSGEYSLYYYKTDPDKQVVEPKITEFEFTLDATNYHSNEAGYTPTAYCSSYNDSTVIIGMDYNEDAHFNFGIFDFSGIGKYNIGGDSENIASDAFVSDGSVYTRSTDDTRKGFVEIFSYDEDSRICEGKFEIDLPLASDDKDNTGIVKNRIGTFKVQIYK